MATRTFKEDYSKGLEAQKKLLPILQDFFKDETIKETTNNFCSHDYIGFNKKLELKSRFIKHNQYPTAMIGYNKLPTTETEEKFIIIYNYQDGIYYIEYNKEQFNKYDKNFFQRTGRTDKIDTSNKVVYIPYQDLKLIKSY